MERPHRILLLVVLVAVSAHAASVEAQSIWIPRNDGSALILEALHTSIAEFDEDFASGTLSLTGRLRKDEVAAFVLEALYARVSGEGDIHSGTFGNPYIGLEVRPVQSPFFGEIGIRIPVTKDNEVAGEVALLSDPARITAFVPEVASLQAIANIREVSSSGLMTHLRLGPVLTLQEGFNNQTDVLAIFAWKIGLEKTWVRVGSAITGSSLLTGTGGLSLGERTSTQFEVHADFGDWSLRPGLDVRLPIGDVASVIPLVVGISVGAAF